MMMFYNARIIATASVFVDSDYAKVPGFWPYGGFPNPLNLTLVLLLSIFSD